MSKQHRGHGAGVAGMQRTGSELENVMDHAAERHLRRYRIACIAFQVRRAVGPDYSALTRPLRCVELCRPGLGRGIDQLYCMDREALAMNYQPRFSLDAYNNTL